MLRWGVMADMTANASPVSDDISKNPAELFGELFESECGDVSVGTSFAVFKNCPFEQGDRIIRK
jgi:hypothetical protein